MAVLIKRRAPPTEKWKQCGRGFRACSLTSNEIVKKMKQHIHVAITVIGRQMILLFYAYNCRMGAIAYAYL